MTPPALVHRRVRAPAKRLPAGKWILGYALQPHLIFCHNVLGRWARSMVFMYRYSRPSSSRMVAYLLFARGQDDLLHSPVTLYSFLQKFCVLVFTL